MFSASIPLTSSQKISYTLVKQTKALHFPKGQGRLYSRLLISVLFTKGLGKWPCISYFAMLYKSEASAFVHTTDTTAGCKERQKREEKNNSYIGKKSWPVLLIIMVRVGVYMYIYRERFFFSSLIYFSLFFLKMLVYVIT